MSWINLPLRGSAGGVSQSTIVSVTPTLDTNAYASGDRLGSLQTISSAVLEQGGVAILSGVYVLDKASQNASMDILIFDESPTITSADNSPINISDSEMEKCIGTLSVGSCYVDLANNSVAESSNANIMVKSVSGSQNLFAIPIIRAAATYAASSLTFKYNFLQS